MTKHFHNEIERLKKRILHLAALVEDSLRFAVQAVTEGDLELAQRVVNADEDIDSLEVEVEEDCLKILALHQPVAADLRYVVAVLKINSDLERIADLAVNIAERAGVIALHRHNSAMPFDLSTMLELVVVMVKESVESLVSSDTGIARRVCQSDDQIDDRHREAFKSVQEHLGRQEDSVDYLMSLVSVSRNLERIADHATNIAEDVIYMIEGEIVRHQDLSSRP